MLSYISHILYEAIYVDNFEIIYFLDKFIFEGIWYGTVLFIAFYKSSQYEYRFLEDTVVTILSQ